MKTLAAISNSALISVPSAVSTPKVAKKTSSLVSSVTAGSFASVWSMITARVAKKGAKNKSAVGYNAGISLDKANQYAGEAAKVPKAAVFDMGPNKETALFGLMIADPNARQYTT